MSRTRIVWHAVVAQVEVTIDSRITGYSACNLCNGTDPFSNKTCEKGVYVCDCEQFEPGSQACDSTKVRNLWTRTIC